MPQQQEIETRVLMHLYRLQQSKLTHVNYMNDKMGKLFLRMSNIGKAQHAASEKMLDPLNKAYSLRKRLTNKDQKDKTPSLKPLINLLSEIETDFFSVNDYMQTSAKEIGYLSKSLRISTLKMSHFMWRERLYMAALRSSADGLNNIGNSTSCALGKWIAGAGQEEFGMMAEFVRLKNLHEELHKVGDAVAALLSHSQPIEADGIIRVFERLEIMSQGVVNELDKLDDWQIKSAEMSSYQPQAKTVE